MALFLSRLVCSDLVHLITAIGQFALIRRPVITGSSCLISTVAFEHLFLLFPFFCNDRLIAIDLPKTVAEITRTLSCGRYMSFCILRALLFIQREEKIFL